MRRVTDEERELFLTALRGHVLPKPHRQTKMNAAKPEKVAEKLSEKKAAHRSDKRYAEPPPEEHVSDPKRRRVTAEERELFLAMASGRDYPVLPAKAKPVIAPAKPRIPKTPGGLDGNTAKRLERGDVAPSAKLDLHGLTEAAAHAALMAFVLAAHRRGDRLLLIVTGKGSSGGDPQRMRGILRGMVPRWMEEAPLAKLIADKRWAHRRHGGEGALYVYLRKA